MTMDLDGAQSWENVDANKNPSNCGQYPLPGFSHPDSQFPGEAGELSPDEETD